jgi:protein involved in polysaccharide export with SLBB domain
MLNILFWFKMKVKLLDIRILLTVSIFFFAISLYAQDSGLSQNDLSKVQVDQLTDDQIKSFVQRAEQSGMTQQQLESAALSRGMQPIEIEKLKTRIDKIKNEGGTKTDSDKFHDRSRSYKSTDEDKQIKKDELFNGNQKEGEEQAEQQDNNIFNSLTSGKSKKIEKKKPEDKIFGFSIFNNKKLSFEPNLNIPTPENYQLGPDDELIIDVWGASQQTYKQKISPEGSIIISNVGLIYLSGMTIKEAAGKIKKELSNIYAGLRGTSPNTFLKVSIGNVRSIKVNIVGEVLVPGTYTLPSLATVFNALYAAGGPSLNGTLRNVRVVRENKTIAELDFYDFLLKGEQKNNINLQDQDVIFISPYENRVEVKGEVKRPMLYDVKNDETLKDLIYFTGGYTGKAYFQQIKIFRKTSRENKVVDISLSQIDTLKMHNGDEVMVDSILKRFENRIEIKGAVYRPGVFSRGDSITLKQLITKAEGLRGDAFKNRVSIYRTREDLTMEVIPVDLSTLLNNSANDIRLEREDLIVIPSIFDIKEEFSVQIEGEVRKPGTYPYIANTTVEDLILQSGGLLESASFARLEIARRIKNSMAENTPNQVAEIYQFQINQDLKLSAPASKFTLQPFDQVFIRRSPGYMVQSLVKLEGEVAFPGSYSIANKTERVSDLVKRAGGITPEAYIKGARLVRKLPVNIIQERKRALKMIKALSKDSLKFSVEIDSSSTIGIDLVKILKQPGSSYDLLLQENDVLQVPKELQTVRLSGQVLTQALVRYDKSYKFKGYISRAGGFAPEAKKSKSYIIYANGMIDRTHKILFFNSYPRVEPGAEIVVPRKPERKGLTTGEAVGISSALATMGLVIVSLINALK